MANDEAGVGFVVNPTDTAAVILRVDAAPLDETLLGVIQPADCETTTTMHDEDETTARDAPLQALGVKHTRKKHLLAAANDATVTERETVTVTETGIETVTVTWIGSIGRGGKLPTRARAGLCAPTMRGTIVTDGWTADIVVMARRDTRAAAVTAPALGPVGHVDQEQRVDPKMGDPMVVVVVVPLHLEAADVARRRIPEHATERSGVLVVVVVVVVVRVMLHHPPTIIGTMPNDDDDGRNNDGRNNDGRVLDAEKASPERIPEALVSVPRIPPPAAAPKLASAAARRDHPSRAGPTRHRFGNYRPAARA